MWHDGKFPFNVTYARTKSSLETLCVLVFRYVLMFWQVSRRLWHIKLLSVWPNLTNFPSTNPLGNSLVPFIYGFFKMSYLPRPMRCSGFAHANGRTQNRTASVPSTGTNGHVWPGAQQQQCCFQSLSPSQAHCFLIHLPSESKRLFDLFAAGKFADKLPRKTEKWGREPGG